MNRVTFTFGPPYDMDGYGWVDLIVEADGKIAHGAHTIPIDVARSDVASLGRASRGPGAEPQMHCGWRRGHTDAAPFDTIILLDIRATESPNVLAVRAEAVDRFEPTHRVEAVFNISLAKLRQFQRDCRSVLRNETKEALLDSEDAATADVELLPLFAP